MAVLSAEALSEKKNKTKKGILYRRGELEIFFPVNSEFSLALRHKLAVELEESGYGTYLLDLIFVFY